MAGAETLNLRAVAEGVVLAVKVVPGASRDRIVGPLGDCLKVATSVAAEKGRANAAVAKILAAAVGIDRRRVRLLAGTKSPRKEFLLEGLTVPEARRRLGDAGHKQG